MDSGYFRLPKHPCPDLLRFYTLHIINMQLPLLLPNQTSPRGLIKQSQNRQPQPKPSKSNPPCPWKPYPNIVHHRPTQRAHIITPGIVVHAIKCNTGPVGLGCEVEVSNLEGGVGVGCVMDILGLITGEGHDCKWLLAFVPGMAQGKRHRVRLAGCCFNHLWDYAFLAWEQFNGTFALWNGVMIRVYVADSPVWFDNPTGQRRRFLIQFGWEQDSEWNVIKHPGAFLIITINYCIVWGERTNNDPLIINQGIIIA